MMSARAVERLGALGALGAELAVALGGDERVEGERPACRSERARSATSWPMRPNPRIPSVFSYTSTPPNRLRSHLPLFSDACACGMLRACASIIAIVCSAAATMFDSGAFATMIPLLRGRRHVDVVDADAGAADHLQPVGALDHVGGQLRGRADHDRVVVARSRREARPPTCRCARRRRSARAGDRRRRRRSSPLRGPGSRSRRPSVRSADRLRGADARAREDFLRGGGAGAEGHVVAELVERQLERPRSRSGRRRHRSSRSGRSGRSCPSGGPARRRS